MDAGKEALLAFTQKLPHPLSVSVTQEKTAYWSLYPNEPFGSACSADADGPGQFRASRLNGLHKVVTVDIDETQTLRGLATNHPDARLAHEERAEIRLLQVRSTDPGPVRHRWLLEMRDDGDQRGTYREIPLDLGEG